MSSIDPVSNAADCQSQQGDQKPVEMTDFQKMISLIPKEVPTEISEKLYNQIQELRDQETNSVEVLMNINKLLSDDILDVHYALTKLRQYVSRQESESIMYNKIQLILNRNIMIYLNRIIKSPNQYALILFEAAWILINILNGTKKQVKEVLNRDGIALLVRVLKCDQLFVKEQALYAFGNIAAESYEYRDELLKTGILGQLIQVCLESYKFYKQFSVINVWALSNFSGGLTRPKFEDVCELLDVFILVIQNSENEEILRDACRGLLAMSHRAIEKIIQAEILPKLVLLLKRKLAISYPVMMLINDLLSGNEDEKDYVLSQPIDFLLLLAKPTKDFQILVLDSLVKITSDSIKYTHMVIYNEKLIEELFIILNDEDSSLETVQIFANILDTCTLDDIEYLVKKGLIKGLDNQLQVTNDDKQLSYVLLGIDILLEKGEELKNKGINLVEEFKLQEQFVNSLKTILDDGDFALQSKVEDIMKYFTI